MIALYRPQILKDQLEKNKLCLHYQSLLADKHAGLKEWHLQKNHTTQCALRNVWVSLLGRPTKDIQSSAFIFLLFLIHLLNSSAYIQLPDNHSAWIICISNSIPKLSSLTSKSALPAVFLISLIPPISSHQSQMSLIWPVFPTPLSPYLRDHQCRPPSPLLSLDSLSCFLPNDPLWLL